jgi:hypothetical protein
MMNVTFGFWLRLAAFVAAMLIGAALSNFAGLGWPGVFLVMIVIAGGGTVMMTRYGERAQERAGALSPALRRYSRRFAVCTLAYLLGLFAATWLFKEVRPTGALAWAIPLLPSAGALAMLWAMVRLLREESDEYIRAYLVRQWLFGGGVLLALATVWGFFEQFRLVPHVPAWAAFPVFAIGMGLSAAVKERRA